MGIDRKTPSNPSALITINEDFIGMWWMPINPGKSDFLLGLSKTEEGTYEMRSRFKHYNSLEPFDMSDGRKQLIARTKKGVTKEQAIEHCRNLLRNMSAMAKQPYDEILVENGNLDKFWEILRQKDWAHSQTVQ